MTAPDTPALAGMSIGAVLDLLRPDFPDVTISKIRFLEAEGLVTPERTASGYRRFTAYDCARLRFILTAQRDQYLPLKVIKAQLDAQPDGELPQTGSAYGVPRLVPVSGESGGRRRDRRGGADPGAAEPRRPAGAFGCRRRAAHRAGQGRRDHTGPGRLLRRALRGDRPVRPGAGRLRGGAAAPARIPVGGRPAVRPDRADRRARWSRRARPGPATAPTTWPAKWRRWRSPCTRR